MRRAGVLAVVALLVGGCSTSAQDLPLPGSRIGGSTYQVDAVFEDALNLAEGAPVKLGGVTIGRVLTVTAEDFTARVRLDVRESTRLHEGATARLRSTTPLGELFVQINDSARGPVLRDGARLGAGDTSAAPTIEDTMTTASLVINGGGLAQLQTIVREANLALGGRETTARDLLGRMARTAKALDASMADIDATLEALAEVSATLDRRRSTINAALRDIPPAARALRKNTDELVELLDGIEDLGGVTEDVIDESRDDLLSTLRKMGPVFEELNALDQELGPGIDTLVRFGELIDRGVPSDYLNTYLHFQGQVSLGVPGTSGDAPRIVTPDLRGSDALKGTPPVPPELLAPPESGGSKGPLGGLLGLFGGGR
jgi:phospholipid/cholesterol/gamma-HCH transport system substrate-binding protein